MVSFAIPGTVIGVSYIVAFNVAPLELTGGMAILVLCFVFRNMPVGVRAGVAALAQIDKTLDEASSTLRASTVRTLREVILPLLRPAILATLVFSFTHAMTAVSAVIFLATAKYNLATVYVINRVEAGEYPLAIAYSAVLILVMLVGAARDAEAHRRDAARPARGAGNRDGELIAWHKDRIGGVVFERVTKRYGDVTAVDDVSFKVAQGELVTLLGPSGCGKTTTLRMVAGLEAVTSGLVLIGGKDVTLRAANERDVSMVFQSYALFPHMTVLENVCYGPISMRIDKAKAREMAREKLKMLGLVGLREAPAVGAFRRPAAARRGGALAGARARGAAVRRAAVEPRRQAPPPRARGDPRAAAVAVADRAVRDARPGGGARGVRPHHRDERRAHRAAGHAGRPVRSAAEPLPRRLHRRRQPGRRRACDRRRRRVVQRRRHLGARARTGLVAGPATLAVRPQRLRIVDAAQGVLPGVCKRVAYLGSRIEYVVATAWGELLAFDNEVRHARRRDDAVGVAFDPDAVIVLKR